MTTITKTQAVEQAKEISKNFRSLVKDLGIKATVKTKPMANCVVISIDAKKASENSIKKLQELRQETKQYWLNINIYNWGV
jgi:hypothetical protein